MSLMINFQDPKNHASYFANGWHYKNCPNVEDLAKYVDKYRTSPAIWQMKKGSKSQRCKANFVWADWICVDVDEGMSLSYALRQIKKYKHIIGTTKNHQKPKQSAYNANNEVTCDRFRFFIKLSERVTNIHDYEYTGIKWARLFKADKSVAYAQAMVAPIKIVRMSEFGKHAIPVDGVTAHKNMLQRMKEQENEFNHHRQHKTIPHWIMGKLLGGCSQRNTTTWMLAKDLLRIGFTESEIVSRVYHSAIPACGDHEFSKKEIEGAVRSAAIANQKEGKGPGL